MSWSQELTQEPDGGTANMNDALVNLKKKKKSPLLHWCEEVGCCWRLRSFELCSGQNSRGGPASPAHPQKVLYVGFDEHKNVFSSYICYCMKINQRV